jgi:hypothetical protein
LRRSQYTPAAAKNSATAANTKGSWRKLKLKAESVR